MGWSVFERHGSPVFQLIENHILDAGGTKADFGVVESQNFQEGARRFVEQVSRLVSLPESDPKRVDPSRISLSECLFALCPTLHRGSQVNHVSEAINKSHFPVLTTNVLNPTVMKAYENKLAGAEQLVTDYGDAEQEDEIVAGFTTGQGLTRVFDGESYQSDHALGEKHVRIQTAVFGKMVELTWNALRFNRTGQLQNRAKNVGLEMGVHRHTYIVQKFLDVAVTATGEAANTSLRYNGTGAAVFSSDHSAIDGQVNDNLDSGVFSYAAVNRLIVLLGKMRTESGFDVPFMPTKIIVPLALQNDALTLFQSPGRFDSGNLAANVISQLFAGSRPTVFASPVIDRTSAVEFYAGAPEDALIWLWTRRPELLTVPTTGLEAARTDVVQAVRVSYGAGCGYGDYRQVAKSTGV